MTRNVKVFTVHLHSYLIPVKRSQAVMTVYGKPLLIRSGATKGEIENNLELQSTDRLISRRKLY